jgi:hypothetical protein
MSACPYSSMSSLIFGVDDRVMVWLARSHEMVMLSASFGSPNSVICHLDLRNSLKRAFSSAEDAVTMMLSM